MNKTVSVREFRAYCEKNRPHHILFYTENQIWYRASDPCKIKMSFPIMLICENPNIICLKSGNNTLSIDRVKEVKIDTESSVLGTVITIFCGDANADNYEIAYTLVAES